MARGRTRFSERRMRRMNQMPEPLPALGVPNVFESNIQLPETVYVIATGEHGRDYYRKIPSDACKIGVNGAVEIGIPLTYYMAFDLNCPAMTWWNCDMHGAVMILGERIAYDPRCSYYFKYYPAMHPAGVMRPYDMLPGILRGGASISACAMQFAYFFGAKRIILVGVDMGGTKHWDGSDVGRAGRPRWSGADKIEMLVAGMMNYKHRDNPDFEGVFALSPTQIRIPRWTKPIK